MKRVWNIISNELKERWPDLTRSDISYINGDQARLLEIVEKRRHISKKEAAADVQKFMDTLDVKRRIA